MKFSGEPKRFLRVNYMDFENGTDIQCQQTFEIGENVDVIKDFPFPKRTIKFETFKMYEKKVKDDLCGYETFYSNELNKSEPTYVGFAHTLEFWKENMSEELYKEYEEVFNNYAKNSLDMAIILDGGNKTIGYSSKDKTKIISPKELKYENETTLNNEICQE